MKQKNKQTAQPVAQSQRHNEPKTPPHNPRPMKLQHAVIEMKPETVLPRHDPQKHRPTVQHQQQLNALQMHEMRQTGPSLKPTEPKDTPMNSWTGRENM